MNKVYSKSAFNLSLLTRKITEKYLAIDRPIPRVGDFVRIGFEISEGQKNTSSDLSRFGPCNSG